MLSVNYIKAFVLVWYCQFNLLAQEKKTLSLSFRVLDGNFGKEKGMAP